jgi:hypothetical protein
MYKVFVRNWWKNNPKWPNGLEPDGGARKTTIGKVRTEEDARIMCKAYNTTHKPGRLSRKAEYTET